MYRLFFQIHLQILLFLFEKKIKNFKIRKANFERN